MLTTWRWALLQKPPVVQLLKDFPTFYGTRRFITVFTRALRCLLSWARSIQPIPPHPVSLRSILILFTHLRLGLPSGLFPSGFHTNILYAFLLSPIRTTCSAHLIVLDLIILIILGEEYKLWSSTLCSFLQPPVTSSLFGPNSLLSTVLKPPHYCVKTNYKTVLFLNFFKLTVKLSYAWKSATSSTSPSRVLHVELLSWILSTYLRLFSSPI
jgi:hypothetical protein